MRDVIDLPPQVHRGDFVLRLTEGVERPGETVGTYVVTPQLAEAFENARGFIRSALQPPSGKAAYLHGRFGSGKCRFMAVLHLLLKRRSRRARHSRSGGHRHETRVDRGPEVPAHRRPRN